MTFDRLSYMRSYMLTYKVGREAAFRRYDADRYLKVKSGAVSLLGGKCTLCQETESEFLTIDHVNSDGNIERSELHHKQIFARILNQSVGLERYRVLCRNCNSGTANEKSFTDDPVSSYSFTGDPCNKCGTSKLVRFSKHPIYGTRKRTECRKCIKMKNRGFRISALALFGSKCKCCLEDNLNKLTIDHVNNDGSFSRSTDHCGTVYFYKRLLSNKLDSAAYQVLCWNCNFSKYLGGGLCVHQRRE